MERKLAALPAPRVLPDSMPTTGIRKAAVLMVALGDEQAKEIYKQLNEQEIERLTQEIGTLEAVAPEVSQAVLEEFHELMETQQYLTFGGPEYAERILVETFGSQRAQALLDQVERSREATDSNLALLQKLDMQQLAKFLEDEHPQTVALVLAHLDPRASSQALLALPEEVRVSAVKRLAEMRHFSDEMAQKVGQILRRRMESLGRDRGKSYSGYKVVADLMNRMDASVTKQVLEAIERENAEMALRIRNLMFTFEDFVTVPASSMTELVLHIDKGLLATALKGAKDNLRMHFFGALSSRAVEMLREDMEVMGPVRGRDITKAQGEILNLARNLEAQGKLLLKPEADDEYVA
ncbi:MAG TPA: flagellar motor switch protein FliG [Acidobacteriaceae bacterium]